MGPKYGWLLTATLPLLLIGMPMTALAAQGEQKASAHPDKSASAAARPSGLMGKIVAVDVPNRTIVVDVPLGKETLRLGAETTDTTKIMAGGKEASLQTLKEGERVRISYHRTDTGDVANSVTAFPQAKG